MWCVQKGKILRFRRPIARKKNGIIFLPPITLHSDWSYLRFLFRFRHCGITSRDLIRVNYFSDSRKLLHLPGYTIAIDHASRSVVLSVRGTFSVQNTLTDLVCDCTGKLPVLLQGFPSYVRF